MKLRVQGNSLRMRLSEKEVQQFAQQGQVEAAVVFGPAPDQILRYILACSPEHQAVAASFAAGTVTVHIPQAQAEAWAATEQNGFSAQVDNGQENGLYILVEKDLTCRHRD